MALAIRSVNVYGEIDKIIYPTGGTETFSYEPSRRWAVSWMMEPIVRQSWRAFTHGE
jgi:hypothetical protein